MPLRGEERSCREIRLAEPQARLFRASCPQASEGVKQAGRAGHCGAAPNV
jgi:hypothetical protein